MAFSVFNVSDQHLAFDGFAVPPKSSVLVVDVRLLKPAAVLTARRAGMLKVSPDPDAYETTPTAVKHVQPVNTVLASGVVNSATTSAAGIAQLGRLENSSNSFALRLSDFDSALAEVETQVEASANGRAATNVGLRVSLVSLAEGLPLSLTVREITAPWTDMSEVVSGAIIGSLDFGYVAGRYTSSSLSLSSPNRAHGYLLEPADTSPTSVSVSVGMVTGSAESAPKFHVTTNVSV